MYAMDSPSRGGYYDYDPEAAEHHHHRDTYDEDDKHKKRRSQTLPLALKWTVVVCLAWGILMMTLGLADTGTGGTSAVSINNLTPGSRLVEQGLEKQKPSELQRKGHQPEREEEDRQQRQQQEQEQLQVLQPPPVESEPQSAPEQPQPEELVQQQELDEDEVLRQEQERQIAEQQSHDQEEQHPAPEQAPHQASGDSKRREEFEAVKAEVEDLKSSWEDRMSSGRELLLTGVDLALQQLMVTRGQRPPSDVDEAELPAAPDFTEAVGVVERAATMFSQSYTGEVEIIERDYVGAMTTLALLRLHEGQFDEVHRLVDEAKAKIDLDPEENAAFMLLQGYAHEAQGSDKAGMFFTLAREYDPDGCRESLLDASYQPPAYQLSVRMPFESPTYWPALADLLLFRELYARRAVLSPAATWPGSVWSKSPQNDGDEYGANLGWGFNWPGLAKAASLLQKQDFVVLREFLHPFELAVLERHYKAKVQSDQITFDSDLGRATSYQDRVGHWLNHRHTQLLSSLAGRSVKHSYSFLCHYERRDGVTPQLRPHTDREDNEVRASKGYSVGYDTGCVCLRGP
jgi:hypothetical protein